MPAPAITEAVFGAGKLSLMSGDITKVPADALVNAANSELIGGGGVDGAVHRAGGPGLMKELEPFRKKGGCPTGKAVVTGGGTLPVRWVVHAVGPVYRGNRFDAMDLEDAYKSAFHAAAAKGCAKVTFPSLSTGAYGYPVEEAAPVALHTVGEELARGGPVKEAVFVLFSPAILMQYARALAELAKR